MKRWLLSITPIILLAAGQVKAQQKHVATGQPGKAGLSLEIPAAPPTHNVFRNPAVTTYISETTEKEQHLQVVIQDMYNR